MVIVQSDTHRQTINLDLNLIPYTNVNSWPPKHDSWFIKEKINELHFIKEKNFFSVKDPVKTMKRLATDWKKTFARHASDKGLVSSIYKEISKFNSNWHTDFKVISGDKRPRTANSILKEMSKIRLTPCSFKTYYKAAVTKKVWHWRKNRNVSQ